MSLPLNQIVHGDCVEILQGFPENSIDLVVTDPPYGLSFMGKEWDKALPPREAFVEIFRVLKPGALAFVMSSPRQDLMARTILLLEDAGFDTKQSFISWIYKTGFPKAYDVSKGIDKKKGLEREVVGKKKLWGHNAGTGAGSFSKNQYEGMTGLTRTEPITAPASDDAKKWDGWKAQTGLKPALEPILMVNKPFSESTIVDNVLRWGTGAINVDACRIPLRGEDISDNRNSGYLDPTKEDWRFKRVERDGITGRFPANLLVSNKAIDDGTIVKTHGGGKASFGGTFGNTQEVTDKTAMERFRGDSGGKSRYFDLDAWAKHNGFLDVAKPDTSEKDFGLKGIKRTPKSKFNKSDGKTDRFDGAVSVPRRNVHPTVKPIKLMAYLIELGCPKDGVVLDPFVGSGTTCIAAKRLCRRYIGIELSEEYHAFAVSRVAAYPDPLEWFIK